MFEGYNYEVRVMHVYGRLAKVKESTNETTDRSHTVSFVHR